MTVIAVQRSSEELLARGWAALPASYRISETAPTLDEARAYCRRLAETHYENFHVATWLLLKALHPHFHSTYGYCRISDDLGDEVPDTITKGTKLALRALGGKMLPFLRLQARPSGKAA